MNWSLENIRNSKVAHLNQHLISVAEKSSATEKKAKYKNKKVFDEFGNEYDSKKERKRAKELRILAKAGLIGFLSMQTEFELIVDGKSQAKYIADFFYIDAKTGEKIVEDVKSEMTRKLPVYRLKRKLMLQIHKIKIKEV